ncbi:MAG: hypothetical protein RIQ51_1136 [Bacteroidota bacterium]
MKKALFAVLLTASFAVSAACPPYAPYGCTPMPNGKMLCGCGR